MNTTSLRHRIIGHRRVNAASLKPHPRNPRTHSPAQRAALAAILGEVGLARSVVAYVADADRALGDAAPLTLIDGHLRKDELADALVDVEILDVSDAEADKLLLTLDPLAQLADFDDRALDEVRSRVQSESNELSALWESLRKQDEIALASLRSAKQRVPPQEISEQYYVLVRCDDDQHQRELLRRFKKEGLSCEAKMC